MIDKFAERNANLNEKIEHLMEHPSLEAERQVYLALSQAVFLMPAMIEDESQMEVLAGRVARVQAGASLRVAQFNGEEDTTLYPAFTSLKEVEAWEVNLEENHIYLLEMDMNSFMEMLEENHMADGFVIDPFHYNLVIQKQQLRRYKEILAEEENKESYLNPMSKMMDQLRDHPTPELEEKIYEAFRTFRFLMPIVVYNEDDIATMTEDKVVTIKEDAEMQVIPLENEEGEKVFPAFTDLYEVNRAGIDLATPEHYLLEMTLSRFETLVDNSDDVMGFAINPFSHNVVIAGPQFAHYHERLAQEENEQEKRQARAEAQAIADLEEAEAYQIETDVHNTDLEKSLAKEMDAQGNVHRAYLLKKVYLDKERYLVIVDKERDGKSIFADLRDAAYPVLPYEDQIEFLSYNEPEAKTYVEQMTPFYERAQKKGIFGLFKGKK